MDILLHILQFVVSLIQLAVAGLNLKKALLEGQAKKKDSKSRKLSKSSRRK